MKIWRKWMKLGEYGWKVGWEMVKNWQQLGKMDENGWKLVWNWPKSVTMEKEEGKLVKNWIERFEIGIEQLENDQKWWKNWQKLGKMNENRWESFWNGRNWIEKVKMGIEQLENDQKWPKIGANWFKLAKKLNVLKLLIISSINAENWQRSSGGWPEATSFYRPWHCHSESVATRRQPETRSDDDTWPHVTPATSPTSVFSPLFGLNRAVVDFISRFNYYSTSWTTQGSTKALLNIYLRST